MIVMVEGACKVIVSLPRFRTLILAVAGLLVMGALSAPSGASNLAPTHSAEARQFAADFTEMMSSPSMSQARAELRRAPSARALGSVVPADVVVAVRDLPSAIARLAPANQDERVAKALLEYWTSQPEYARAARSLLESQAWAVDTMVTKPVAGGALLSWAVTGLLDGNLFSGVHASSFWGHVGAIAIGATAALTIAVACVGTLGVPCVAAAAGATLVAGLESVALLQEEAASAGSLEGAVAFTAQCRFYNVCEINNLTFTDGTHPYVAFSARWVTITQPAFEANSEADCYNGAWINVHTPASAAASGSCFNQATASSARYYTSKVVWNDTFYTTSTQSYAKFRCADRVGVEVSVTWNNGKRARGVYTSSKPVNC